ncbi:MAG: type II toxin-antitoxin system death-on-curing family toxin, partial [Ureaplasma sp.]|nr:type II toxin-antitoxin system death-on-curing family toxin [Ureaplasma sp.]
YELIKNTFINVYPEYKDEPIDQSKRNEIENLIFRKITNICNGYINYGIIEFINDIFISIITEHKLENGNKRMAQAVLQILLRNFGYYFKYSNLPKNRCPNQKMNLKDQLINMLENYTNDCSDNDSRFENLRIQSNKYIWDNILISFYKK